jgi:hypothetical protein
MALAHTYASGADLPPELHPPIIQNLYRPSDLKVAALVSSDWRVQAQKQLFSTLRLPKDINSLISLSNDIRDNHAILAGVRTITIPDATPTAGLPMPAPPQTVGELFEAIHEYILSIFESRKQLLCVNIERTGVVFDEQIFHRLVGTAQNSNGLIARTSDSDRNQNGAVDSESNLGIGAHNAATAISCISTIRFDQPMFSSLTFGIFDTLGPTLSGLSLTESCQPFELIVGLNVDGSRLEMFQNAMREQLERHAKEELVERRKVKKLAVDVEALGVGTGVGAALYFPLRYLSWGTLERLVVQWHHAKRDVFQLNGGVGTARSRAFQDGFAHFLETVAGSVKELKMRVYSNFETTIGPEDERLLRE